VRLVIGNATVRPRAKPEKDEGEGRVQVGDADVVGPEYASLNCSATEIEAPGV